MSAPSHLTVYRSDAFGDDFRSNIFISHFNTRSVTRSRLTPDGSTFRADNEPFLVSTSPDFHPCGIIEDADGSLLVIDTGGWFKIGCPTSSMQPEVLGGIYRVRRKDQPSPPDPRGTRIAWDAESAELVKFLADDRFVVRDRAINTLVRHGESAIKALRETLGSKPVRARRNAVWALTRMGTPESCSAARFALDDADPSVRMAAAVCAATHRDAGALEVLVALLSDPKLAVRRQAATALGRISNADAVPSLLKTFEDARDRMLEHAIIYALIEINAAETTAEGMQDPSSRIRRAALVALDQMESSKLTRELVSPLMETDDAELLEAVVDVVGRHPEWVEIVVEVLRKWLLEPELTPARQVMLRDAVYALRRQEACQTLMSKLLSQPNTPAESRILLLDVMVDSGFREFPASWQTQLFFNLHSSDNRVARKSLLAMASTATGQFDEGLLRYTQDATRPVSLRVQSADVLSRNRKTLSESTFALLCSQCSPDAAFDTRLEAARAIGNLKLSSEQLDRVIDLAAQAGPLELPLLLKPLAGVWQDDSGKAGRRLTLALEKSPGFASLNEEQLTALFDGAASEARIAAEPLFLRLKQEYSTSVRQVLRTTFNLVGGDAVRGKEIFFGKRALCSACHRVGPEQGKEMGPDLRGIGEVRSHRDLLEAILAPSASFARGFEPKTVVTTSGRVISGVIHKESDDSIFLYTTGREEVRIARSEVDEIAASTVSIMPQGLERLLTSDELRDLLAYLSSLKRR
jgi:putative heme-binding domain-containing protein